MLIKRKAVRGGRTRDVPYKYRALQRNRDGGGIQRKKEKTERIKTEGEPGEKRRKKTEERKKTKKKKQENQEEIERGRQKQKEQEKT
jgi:hypothetical protein